MNRHQIALYSLITLLAVAAVVLLLRREGGATATPDASAPNAQAEPPKTEDIYAALRRQGGKATSPRPSAKVPAAGRRHLQKGIAGQEQLERLGKLLANARTADEKISLLAELDGYSGNQMIELLTRELEGGNNDLKMAVLAMLAELADPAVLPAVDKAMADPDAEVREAAVEVLGAIEQPQVCAPLLAKALNDGAEDVRDAAFAVLDDKEPTEQNIVFAETIKSPLKDVRERTVDMISFNPSHRAFEILMQGLNDKDPEVLDEVKWNLDYFVNEEFTSYEQALAWWKQNQHRYDEELFEK